MKRITITVSEELYNILNEKKNRSRYIRTILEQETGISRQYITRQEVLRLIKSALQSTDLPNNTQDITKTAHTAVQQFLG